MIAHQAIIVGGGLAGLRAALELRLSGIDVGVLSKVYPLRSHSCMAQGGLNAALGNHPEGGSDNPERHAFDTVKGSDYLADQNAVEVMTREAVEIVYEMEHWGCPWSRFDNGRIAQRPFGGQSFARTCYGADKTGLYLLQTLYEQCVKHDVKFYDEFLVLSLVVAERQCSGVVAYEIATGNLHGVCAPAVMFATGGAGRIYSYGSNSMISTGFGAAIAYRGGVPLKDMEFFQFHPTTLVGQGLTISEGLRGQGAYLFNGEGERFMRRYVSDSVMERAPRDIVARAIQIEINSGRGIGGEKFVHLDARHLGADRLRSAFPGIVEVCQEFRKIDPTREMIPVQPGTHYTMGGIDVNVDCESEVEGFYAAGECACVSVHGANRLGGNSLVETIVFGRRAGRSMSRYLQDTSRAASVSAVAASAAETEKNLCALAQGSGNEEPARIRREMNSLMDENVMIFRDEASLARAVGGLQSLKRRYRQMRAIHGAKQFNYDLIWAVELAGSLQMAEAAAASAHLRRESRGSHYRTDFPQRDDERFLAHSLAYHRSEGPDMRSKPVTITRWQPQERRY